MSKENILANFLVNLQVLRDTEITTGPARGNWTTEDFGAGGRVNEPINYGGYVNCEYDIVHALHLYADITGDESIRAYSIPSAENFRDFLIASEGGMWQHDGSGEAPLAWIQDILNIAHPEFTPQQVANFILSRIAAHIDEFHALPAIIGNLEAYAQILADDSEMQAQGFSSVAQLDPYFVIYGGDWGPTFPRIQPDYFASPNQHAGGHSLVEVLLHAHAHGFPGTATYESKARLVGQHQLAHEIPEAIDELQDELDNPNKYVQVRQIGWPLVNMVALYQWEIEHGHGDPSPWLNGINAAVGFMSKIPLAKYGGTNHVSLALESLCRYREALRDGSFDSFICDLAEHWCSTMWSDEEGAFENTIGTGIYIPRIQNGLMTFGLEYARQLGVLIGRATPKTSAVLVRLDDLLGSVSIGNARDFAGTYRMLLQYVLGATPIEGESPESMTEIAMLTILRVFGCQVNYLAAGRGTYTPLAIFRRDYPGAVRPSLYAGRRVMPAIGGAGAAAVVSTQPMFTLRARDIPRVPWPHRDRIIHKGKAWEITEAHRNGCGYDLIARLDEAGP